MVCSPSNCPTLAPAAVTDLAHRVHVDGREQVLEHGGHELDVHALGAEAVEHQEGRVVKLLLVHPVSAQGRDHVPYQCILADLERQSGASWEPHQLQVYTVICFGQNKEVCDPQGASHCHTVLQGVLLSNLINGERNGHKH